MYCSVAEHEHTILNHARPDDPDQTTASTIHQPRLGHSYFRAFLARLPNYISTQCQCSERVQSVKHLLLGCRTYQKEREKQPESLGKQLCTPSSPHRGDFIKSTKVATRGWLLQGGGEGDSGDKWECVISGESTTGDREAER